MESFATIVNGFQLLTIVAKLSILDVSWSPDYAFVELTDFLNMFFSILATKYPYYQKPYPPFKLFKFFPFGGAPYGAKCVRWNIPGGATYNGKKWIGDLCYDLGNLYRNVEFQWSTTGT